MRRSVFWRLAAVLAGVQIALGLLSVLLGAWFAYDRSLNLAGSAIRLRMDDLADEVEHRAIYTPEGTIELPPPLLSDLSARFPDPIYVLHPDGSVRLRVDPDLSRFRSRWQPPSGNTQMPPDLQDKLVQGRILLELNRGGMDSWGLAPLYDPDGLLVGGLLVLPLHESIQRELAPTRDAYARTLAVVTTIAALVAILVSALLTLALVRPLQRVTRKIEQIGGGQYDVRLKVVRDDELGRLSASINRMAAEVAASIETLREADALRRELIANVGHDLRTPMAAMLMYLEEAGRSLDAGDTSRAAATIASAGRQGTYLKQLIADLFELSLLDSPSPPLRKEPIPVGELLQDAADSHRALFREAGITLEVEIPQGLPVIEADGVRLLRLMDNLLDNARRHTSPPGRVRLAATHSPSEVTITVQDTGVGMDQEMVSRIFERYYRGDDARTRKQEGTGLGLSISRATARAHGGELHVTSAPGEGSTFTLRLPNAHEG